MCKHSTSESQQPYPLTLFVRLTLDSTDVNFIASQALARSQQISDQTADDDTVAETDERTDAMAALERQARAPQGFVPASSGPEGGNVPKLDHPVTVNPDAIDVDSIDDI